MGTFCSHLSGVERTQQAHVPWPFSFFIRSVLDVLLWLLRVDQVVRIVAQRLADDEGSFPWGR